jgi:hypothetical protein
MARIVEWWEFVNRELDILQARILTADKNDG